MTKRYIVMSIPGTTAANTWWVMFDVKRHETVPDACLPGEQGRLKLAKLARFRNEKAIRSRKRRTPIGNEFIRGR